MDCTAALELFQKDEAEVAERDVAAATSHIDSCPKCTAYFQKLERKLRQLMLVVRHASS